MQKTEDELIAAAQNAISESMWITGEAAYDWRRFYARGRSLSDFAIWIDSRRAITGEEIERRIKVWTRFGKTRHLYLNLRWAHFFAALEWDDAEKNLSWADQNIATPAEMRAWRRACRGEDLTVDTETDA